MPDPTTTNKLLFTPAHGADVDTWDVPVNANWNGIDQALGTYTTLNANGLSGTIALTTSQAIPLGFIITGTPAGSINYQVPAGIGGIWLTRNQATLGASITIGFSSASGGSTVTIPAGKNLAISADGTANGMADIDTVPTSAAGGSNNQVQVNVAGVLGGYAGFTFDGATFHTPELTVDGNAIFGTGSGSTLTINGTAISVPNGFNFNAGAFQMNAGGMIGIGTAPTSALLTVGGQVNTTAGGYKYPDATISTTANGKVLQLAVTTVPAATTGLFAGTYSTTSGAAPTTAGGVQIPAFNTTFTPTSASSILEIEVVLKGAAQGNEAYYLALFSGSTLIDFAPQYPLSGAGVNNQIVLKTWYSPGATTAMNLTVRIGGNSGIGWWLNQVSGGTNQAGWTSWLTIKEIKPGGP